jgi:hypothetical protein
MSKIAVGFRLPENDYVRLLTLSRLEGSTLSEQLTKAVGWYVQGKQQTAK